nr:MAG TPA: hypothetical protein [Caudoviricetes sp.]
MDIISIAKCYFFKNNVRWQSPVYGTIFDS